MLIVVILQFYVGKLTCLKRYQEDHLKKSFYTNGSDLCFLWAKSVNYSPKPLKVKDKFVENGEIIIIPGGCALRLSVFRYQSPFQLCKDVCSLT